MGKEEISELLADAKTALNILLALAHFSEEQVWLVELAHERIEAARVSL